MAKDLIEDIKRPKRSLQDVLPASSATSKSDAPVILPTQYDRPSRTRRRRWPIILPIILAAVIAGTYFLSIAFGRAVVTITVRRLPLAVSGTYRTVNLPNEAAPSTVLGFQTMVIQGSESITVPAGEAVAVAERASGKIIITNRHSQKVEKLVTNTRFESSDGKIYRIQAPVLIPGYTLVGGVIKSGELTVKVVADQPGPSYNGAKTTFTIPGFKNDSRFKTITAQAEGAFTGGFIGERRVVSDTVRSTAEAELLRRLKERLLAEATGQSLDDYIWYPSNIFWRLEEASTTNVSTGQQIALSRRAELVVPIFSRAELSQILARRLLPSYDGAPVLFENLEQLDFHALGPSSDPQQLTEFSFTLAGEGDLVWSFDQTALVNDLLDRSTRDYQAVFVKYPNIISSTVTFKPPWLTRFPTNPERISLSADKAGLTAERPPAKMSTTTNQSDIPNGN
ncbi:MAG: hypothetical protein V1704_00340 [Candidatus Vogelbacteria bacterium]